MLLGSFLVSILIRLPNLDRPLSNDYEWVTAHTLITLDIWRTDGALRHRLAPIYTYPYAADTHIESLTSGVADAEGRYYYVSYPPLTFIAPHLVFTALRIAPSPLALQGLNLVLHALTAWCLYLLVAGLRRRPLRDGLDLPALAAFLVYTFSAPNLWFHANVYFADVLVQLFFVAAVWAIARHVLEDRPIWPVGVALFLMTYTEWLGVFLTATVAGVAAARGFDRRWMRVAGVCIAGSGLALLVTFLQYASIAGASAFIDASVTRFAVRSGQSQGLFGNPEAYLSIGIAYARGYFPQAVLLVVLGAAAWTTRAARPAGEVGWLHWIGLTLAPALMHHLVFFEFTTIHDFALLKTSVPLALGTAACMDRLCATDERDGARFYAAFGLGVTAALLAFSVFLYYAHITHDAVDQFQLVGETVGREARSDETVFIVADRSLYGLIIPGPDHDVVAPQILYYAGRDILLVDSIDDAYRHLETYGKPRGVLFSFAASRQAPVVTRLTLPRPAPDP
ncbi:MAG: hypothetical protein R2834_04450 [Rhodothermales bacterium]